MCDLLFAITHSIFFCLIPWLAYLNAIGFYLNATEIYFNAIGFYFNEINCTVVQYVIYYMYPCC